MNPCSFVHTITSRFARNDSRLMSASVQRKMAACTVRREGRSAQSLSKPMHLMPTNTCTADVNRNISPHTTFLRSSARSLRFWLARCSSFTLVLRTRPAAAALREDVVLEEAHPAHPAHPLGAALISSGAPAPLLLLPPLSAVPSALMRSSSWGVPSLIASQQRKPRTSGRRSVRTMMSNVSAEKLRAADIHIRGAHDTLVCV